MLSDDRVLYDAIVSGIIFIAAGWALFALGRTLERRRPGLELAAPLALAAVLRLGTVALFAAVGSLGGGRGPDEGGFFVTAHRLVNDPGFLGPFPDGVINDFHIWIMAAQLKVFGEAGDIPL